jgi:hypothetical protein
MVSKAFPAVAVSNCADYKLKKGRIIEVLSLSISILPVRYCRGSNRRRMGRRVEIFDLCAWCNARDDGSGKVSGVAMAAIFLAYADSQI